MVTLVTAECPVCGAAEAAALSGSEAEPRVELECFNCARPWIMWSCEYCGRMNYQQVDALPRPGAFAGVCLECGFASEKANWTPSSRDVAYHACVVRNWAEARPR